MTDRTHPDSGRIITSSDILLHDAETALLYEELRAAIDDGHESMTHSDALAGIAAIRAENTELRAQLEAIGAAGVSGPLIGRAALQSPSFDAADMATAAAQGFRDGVASVSAGWIRVDERLPEPGTPVLLDIGKKYPIRAMWAAKHTVQAADDDTDWGEYVEEDDMYYAPEGWYEWNQCEDNHWRVTETPRAWMPLPPTSAEGVEHG